MGVYLCATQIYKTGTMPKKIKATGAQKSMFMIHTVVFLIATILSFMFYDKGVKGWAYPWHAWTVATWGLWLLGHGCIVFASIEDPGYDTYRQQQGKK
jgi:uncharacterized BrkB/YihY/UPF0761 family membrane protein